MINIRKSEKKDSKEILAILKETDIYYPAVSLGNFWVAEDSGMISGVVQFKEFKDYFFLSSLGVKKTEQNKGIARALVEEMISIAGKKKNKDIYLFTTLPSFFKKLGFKIAQPLPALPSKDRYQCEECSPGKCVTMVL